MWHKVTSPHITLAKQVLWPSLTIYSANWHNSWEKYIPLTGTAPRNHVANGLDIQNPGREEEEGCKH